MLGEFEKVIKFIGKTKLANDLYVENLNLLSSNKSHTNYMQQVVSKITKENNSFKILTIH